MSGFYLKKQKKTNKNILSEKECRDIERRRKEAVLNRTVTVKINGFDDDLCGTAVIDGCIYHVRNSVLNDVLTIEKKPLSEREVFCDYIDIVTPSEYRISDKICPHFKDCGNCNLCGTSYEYQLILKTKRINKIAQKFKCYAQPCFPSKIKGYRNKVHLAFTEAKGKTVVGFFNEETHSVIPIKKCEAHGEWLVTLISILNDWATKSNLSAYKPWKNNGLLRFAVARYLNGGLMLTIVATEKIRNSEKLYKMLSEKFKKVSLYQNVNNKKSSEVFSDNFIFIDGEKKLNSELLGIKFNLGPNSFYQVNEGVACEIYKTVCEEITNGKENCVVDAYSGIGITSALFAKSGKNVVSIEIEKKAVEDARVMAKINNVSDRINFIAADCNAILPKLKTNEKVLFFVDPPRKGLGKNVCKTIIGYAPEKIVYLSCNPISLELDLQTLVSGGYRVLFVKPYDMFPQTKHVETLVCLSKKK